MINQKILDRKQSPIALYGIGEETARTLTELADFNIVGLLDGYKESGEIYGFPIISLSDVVSMGVGLIVVIARPGSCRAIADRIGEFCKDNNITLIDANGNDLLAPKKVLFTLESFDLFSADFLLSKAQKYNAVSFDLFDTLVMRKVFAYTDIFFRMEDKLISKGLKINKFPEKRILVEKNLSTGCVPTLEEIYTELLKRENMLAESAVELAEIEWQLDFETIIPRNEVIRIFNTLKNENIKIIITTDSYYNKGKILKICEKNGINADDIFVSCEYGINKRNGLFEELKNKYPKLKILHIGDDEISDKQSADNAGFDSLKIYSAYEMFEKCGYFGLEKYLDSYNGRLKVGLVISRIFNSPFAENDKISISGCNDFGYAIIGEIISDFTLWLHERIKESKIKNIWFCARDGFLIRKLYSRLSDSETVYFFTSRIAALRAGTQSEQDIKYIGDMKFSGSDDDQLKMRYGLNCPVKSENDIVSRSVISRKNYLKYISTINFDSSDIAFFDFVAKGTSQMFVQRLVSNHVSGFYFLKLPNYSELIKNTEIHSYIDTEKMETSTIYDDYYILEPILTSQEPSVIDFDCNGVPVYAEEFRSPSEIQCIIDIQNGIEEYFNDYLKLSVSYSKNIGPAIGEAFLSFVHKFDISDNPISGMNVEDMFFNRITNIKSLI